MEKLRIIEDGSATRLLGDDDDDDAEAEDVPRSLEGLLSVTFLLFVCLRLCVRRSRRQPHRVAAALASSRLFFQRQVCTCTYRLPTRAWLGFCLKTEAEHGAKIFVNICHSDKVHEDEVAAASPLTVS